MPEQLAPKTRMICKTCKSDKVAVDAWAVWDGWSFQLLDTTDAAFCNDCGGETKVVFIPVE